MSEAEFDAASRPTCKLKDAVDKIVEQHPGLPGWAYVMVFEAMERIFISTEDGVRRVRPVEPFELARAYPASAVCAFGFLSETVLRDVGISTVDDLWTLCLRLHERGLLVFGGSVQHEKAKFDAIPDHARNTATIARLAFEKSLQLEPPKILRSAS